MVFFPFFFFCGIQIHVGSEKRKEGFPLVMISKRLNSQNNGTYDFE